MNHWGIEEKILKKSSGFRAGMIPDGLQPVLAEWQLFRCMRFICKQDLKLKL